MKPIVIIEDGHILGYNTEYFTRSLKNGILLGRYHSPTFPSTVRDTEYIYNFYGT